MTQTLFAFDIDGTLLDHKDHLIPASAKKALIELKRKGHIIGIATGRNKWQLEKVIDLSLFDFAIMCNGSFVEINGNSFISNNFPDIVISKITKILEEHNYEYLVSSKKHLYGLDLSSKKKARVIDQFDLVPPHSLHNFNLKNIFQFVVCEPIEVIQSFKSIQDDVIFHPFGKFGFDIDQIGVTKGSVLQDVVKYFNINMDNVYAFGDAANDITLIKNAGVGIALGNAIQEVKDVADYVTSHVGDNGIYNALKKFGFIR